jgi:hypothetical protein
MILALQDLAVYLGVGELNSTASFPSAMDNFKATLARVEACSATRSLVEGDTAALCASIKAGVLCYWVTLGCLLLSKLLLLLG